MTAIDIISLINDGLFLFALIGLTWTFHLTFTVWMIFKNQPDLRQNGTFFSLTLIYLVNLVIILLGFGFISQMRFDYDFRALENSDLPSFRLDLEVNEILGFSQTPTVVLTQGEEQERRVVGQLRAQQEKLGDASSVDFRVSNAFAVVFAHGILVPRRIGFAIRPDGLASGWVDRHNMSPRPGNRIQDAVDVTRC